MNQHKIMELRITRQLVLNLIRQKHNMKIKRWLTCT